MGERVGMTDEVNRRAMGFSLKSAAFLAAVAVVMTFTAAPGAKAAQSVVSGRALDYSHPCRTYDPCEGVPGATVFVDKYVSSGWVREGAFTTGAGGGYPTLGLTTGYWWRIEAYKWVQRSACAWDLYGVSSGAFWPTHNPYLIQGGVDHLVDLGLTYLRSHSSCSQAPPSSVGGASGPGESEPPDGGAPPLDEGAPPDDASPPIEGTAPADNACRRARTRSRLLGKQVKRLRRQVKRGSRSARPKLRKARRKLRRARGRFAASCRA